MTNQQPGTVPLEATLAHTRRQRNAIADENAMLWAHVEELTAERDQLREENDKLRADALSSPEAGTAAAGSAAPGPYA